MADICIWNKCNNGCVMCTNPDGFWKEDEYGYPDLVERMLSMKKDITHISMTGGEPTMNPHFFQLVDFLKLEFSHVSINLLSNGRMFFYPLFAAKCLEISNIEICISLHGYNSDTHGHITLVKESFDQTIAGIRNVLELKKNGQKLEIRVVITKINVNYVHKIVEFICNNFPTTDRLVLIFLEPEGKANRNKNKVGVTYSEWKEATLNLRRSIVNVKELRLYHFPLCMVDHDLWKYVWRTLPSKEVAFAKVCKKCWCMEYCLGVHKGYLDLFGSSEFMPPIKVDVRESGNFHHPIDDVCL